MTEYKEGYLRCLNVFADNITLCGADVFELGNPSQDNTMFH